MKHLRMICLILIGFVNLTFSQNLTARVVRIKDGDTIELLTVSKKISARLSHFDAPERKQFFGENSKDSLTQIFQNQIIEYRVLGKDLYGRLLISIPKLDSLMISKGWAWHYSKYCHCTKGNIWQQNAQYQKLGLWTCSNVIEPWIYRDLSKQDKKRYFECQP